MALLMLPIALIDPCLLTLHIALIDPCMAAERLVMLSRMAADLVADLDAVSREHMVCIIGSNHGYSFTLRSAKLRHKRGKRPGKRLVVCVVHAASFVRPCRRRSVWGRGAAKLTVRRWYDTRRLVVGTQPRAFQV